MFATHLRCLRCGLINGINPLATLCPRCGPGDEDTNPGIFDVVYDYAAAKEVFASHVAQNTQGQQTIFRFLPILPVSQAPETSLPSGGTPLVAAPRLAARLGVGALYLKDETRNPTRCLKDRATAIAVCMAQQNGQNALYCASAGNAAISLAGFCAHQELDCHVFVPREVSTTRLAWLKMYGAHVSISEGSYDVAFEQAELAGKTHGWYSRNCAFNPYLVEGKKTVAFEIAEQLAWRVPDIVVAPVGDGCTLGAVGKGFRELVELEMTDHLPQLLGVQAEAIQPVVQRYTRQADKQEYTSTQATIAASIAVRRPRNYLRLRAALNASGGTMLAVPDEEMLVAQRLLAHEAGVVAEVTSAASLAGLIRLSTNHDLSKQSVVLIVTGGRLDAHP
jgi:threonine synthase